MNTANPVLDIFGSPDLAVRRAAVDAVLGAMSYDVDHDMVDFAALKMHVARETAEERAERLKLEGAEAAAEPVATDRRVDPIGYVAWRATMAFEKSRAVLGAQGGKLPVPPKRGGSAADLVMSRQQPPIVPWSYAHAGTDTLGSHGCDSSPSC